MRFQYLACLLLAGSTYGQTAPPATPPAAGAKAEPSTSAVPDKAPEIKAGPDDPVITLKGLCTDSTQQGDACKTVITRAQFEKIADALQPGMPPAMRRQLATRYGWALKMSIAAENAASTKRLRSKKRCAPRAYKFLRGSLPTPCGKMPIRLPTPMSRIITRKTRRPTSKLRSREFLFPVQSKFHPQS